MTRIRRGGPGDAPLMLAMLDGAVAWLAANGRTGQWGSEPWSRDPRRVERITGIARDDEIWVAEVDGRLVEYYRRNGFEPVAQFRVGDWPGRLLSQRVAAAEVAKPAGGTQPGK